MVVILLFLLALSLFFGLSKVFSSNGPTINNSQESALICGRYTDTVFTRNGTTYEESLGTCYPGQLDTGSNTVSTSLSSSSSTSDEQVIIIIRNTTIMSTETS